MRRRWLAWVALAELVLASPARAGIYDPGEREPVLAPLRQGKDLPFELFRDALVDAVRAADALQSGRPPRKGLLERRTGLRKNGLDRLAAAQLVELGVVHLRLREVDAALDATKRALDRNPRDFWALTTLATAYQV